MKIETNLIRQMANQLLSQIQSLSFNNSQLFTNHQKIINDIYNLSNYFSVSCNRWEENEDVLVQTSKGKLNYSHNETGNALGWLFKKNNSLTFSQTIQYQYGNAALSYKALKGNISALKLYANGKIQCRLWKDKQFYPSLQIVAKADASLLSANANLCLGNDKIYARANANGWLGVCYANAKAVLNPGEQSLSLGAGASFLKGSVSCSFHFLSASITLSGTGSIGSVEANLEYSHKNREWEFGSKLGFICGLGFKVKVNY